MKKILALLLSLMLLIGTCAFAEEAAATRSFALSDVVINYGESTIDLSNVNISLEFSEDDPALLARIEADGETAAELGVTKVDGLNVLHVAGMLTGHKDFVVDPVFQTEKALRQSIDGLIAMLQSIDTNAAAQKLVSFLESPMPEPEAELEEEPVEEPAVDGATATIDLSSISFQGDVVEALQNCVTTQQGVEMDGSTGIPAGTYDVESFSLDEEAIAGILDMIYQDGEPIGLGDKLRESGAMMTVNVANYGAEGADAVSVEMNLEAEGQAFDMRILASKTGDESGSVSAYDISVNNDGTPAGLKFTISQGTVAEASFTPASVDLANAVNLDEMTDDEAFAALSETFESLQADALIPFAAPFMQLMMQNIDLNELQATIDAMEAEAPAEVPEAE